MGYYISKKNIEIKPLDNSPYKTLDELYFNLYNYGWNEFTVFKHSQWNESCKASGQCNGTVILVQKYFGGDIYYYDKPDEEKRGHYFNRINGVDIDLTSEQFAHVLKYSSITKASFKKNLNSRSYFESRKSAILIEQNIIINKAKISK